MFSLIVPDSNYGNIEDIHLYAWTNGGILNVNRVAIDFDLSMIQSYAIIDSAFLSLYHNPTSVYNLGRLGNEGENSIIIQRIIEDWDEITITWNLQPDVDTTNQVYIPKSNNPTQDYVNIRVTDLVQDAIADKISSHGFMLRHEIEEPYKITFFASSEHPNEKLHPKLVVHYSYKK